MATQICCLSAVSTLHWAARRDDVEAASRFVGSWLGPLVQIHMSQAGQLSKLLDADENHDWDLFTLAVLASYQAATLQVNDVLVSTKDVRVPWELSIALQILAAMIDPHGKPPDSYADLMLVSLQRRPPVMPPNISVPASVSMARVCCLSSQAASVGSWTATS